MKSISNMKFKLCLTFALAGLLSGSCMLEEAPEAENTILAVMENDQTRTSVTDEGSFTWSAGDNVWLHTTSGSVVGSLASGAGTPSASFGYGIFIGDLTGKAVYPYNSGHAVSGNELNVVLPASYDLGSNLTNTNAAMYGVNVGGTIRFNHLAGVMRFVFKNAPVGTDKFQLTLDKKINGTFTADLTQDYPVIETGEAAVDSEKTITLTFDALTSVSDISLYVPLPLGTYGTLGLELCAGDKSLWAYSNTVTNTIGRKTLKLMPSVNMGGFVDGEIDGGNSAGGQEGDYLDEYGVNHGPGIDVDGVVWAPVNCGYHKDDYQYGKLYQWGRKYGQGYSGNLYDLNGNETGAYSDATVPELVQGPVSLSVGQSKDNENKFYFNSLFPYDWCNSQNDELWNSGTEDNPVKTEYDPCPTGWRVPTYDELRQLCENHSSWMTENGQNGYWLSGSQTCSPSVPRVFFPAASRIDSIEGNALNRGAYGRYWSSTPHSNGGVRLLVLYSGGVQMIGNYRASGFSVRCVQVTDEVAEL